MRITKDVAHKLILYAKRLNVTAHFWDPQAKSAFEFYRQMSSPKLKKINPNFDCSLNVVDELVPPKLTAEFADGSKWESTTAGLTCADLRGTFYTRAADIEDLVDIDVAGAVDSAAKKGGGKGGKK